MEEVEEDFVVVEREGWKRWRRRRRRQRRRWMSHGGAKDFGGMSLFLRWRPIRGGGGRNGKI